VVEVEQVDFELIHHYQFVEQHHIQLVVGAGGAGNFLYSLYSCRSRNKVLVFHQLHLQVEEGVVSRCSSRYRSKRVVQEEVELLKIQQVVDKQEDQEILHQLVHRKEIVEEQEIQMHQHSQ
jgi:hypothetical protein